MRRSLSKIFLVNPDGVNDERQVLARGGAWKAACLTLAGCVVAMLFIFAVMLRAGRLNDDVFVRATLASLTLSFVVFQLICIFRDAFTQLRLNGKTQLTSHLTMIAVALFAALFSRLAFGGWEYGVALYALAAYNALISAALAVKLASDKRKAGEGAEE